MIPSKQKYVITAQQFEAWVRYTLVSTPLQGRELTHELEAEIATIIGGFADDMLMVNDILETRESTPRRVKQVYSVIYPYGEERFDVMKIVIVYRFHHTETPTTLFLADFTR